MSDSKKSHIPTDERDSLTPGVGASFGDYAGLWEKLKKDVGIGKTVLMILGTLLIVFSSDHALQIRFSEAVSMSLPQWLLGSVLFAPTLITAFLRWVRAILCRLFFARKKRNPVTTGMESPTVAANEMIGGLCAKSLFVHFPKDRFGALTEMTHQLSLCNDYKTAVLMLISLQQRFGGQMYSSFSPQPFAMGKLNENSPIVKGEGPDQWCWWRWEGGEQGFQLLVSLCQ